MRRILGGAGLLLLVGGLSAVAGAGDVAGQREFHVAENAAPGTSLGRVTADTNDAAASSGATFTLAADGRQVPCRVDPQTGELTLAEAALDFETQSRHEFTVRIRRPRALDPARRAYLADLLQSGVDPTTLDDLLFEVAEQALSLNVADAPEPPRLAPAPVSFVIQADQPQPGEQIAVSDPDADDAYTFELLEGDTARFQIDPHSGVLTCLTSTDTEAGTFPLTVRVTDSAGLSDTATFNVEVIVPTPPAAVVAAEPPTPDASATATATFPGGVLETPDEDIVPPDTDDAPSITIAAEPPPTVSEPIAAVLPATTAPVTGGPAVAEVPALPLAAAAPEAAAVAVTQAALPPSRSRLGWWLMTLVLAGGAVGAGIVWHLRRRAPVADESPTSMFRVVREARMLNAAGGSPVRGPVDDESMPALPLADFDNEDADKEAVHRLIASALQQATGGSPPPPPTMPVAAAPHVPALPPTPVFVRPPRFDVPPPLPAAALVESVDFDEPPRSEIAEAPLQVESVDTFDDSTGADRALAPQAALDAPVASDTFDYSNVSERRVSPQAASDAEPVASDTFDYSLVSERAVSLPAAPDAGPVASDTYDYSIASAGAASPQDVSNADFIADEPAPTISNWQSPVYDGEDCSLLENTEQFALPPAAADAHGLIADADHALRSLPESSEYPAVDEYAGYESIDDELSGSYSGLRLSQPVESSDYAASESPAPHADELMETMSLCDRPGEAGAPQSPEEDEKLSALRRQLSEMFGVPADRPRAATEPARTVDFERERFVEPVDEEFAPPAAEAEPEAPAAAAEQAAPVEPEAAAEQPNDPVSSWLAYVKQRALEQTPSAKPAPAPVPRPVAPPPPTASAAPAVRAPAPAPVTSAPRNTPATSLSSVMRVNKTAVREEISMLRDVANQHSRKILERRALHQRARFAWVLWGTALVILCVAGLTAVQHQSGLIRTVGWALFGGAAIALAGCVRGFQNLSGRPDRALDEEEDDDVADDLERTVAPELMTAEMEMQLRTVMEEPVRNPVGSAGPRS